MLVSTVSLAQLTDYLRVRGWIPPTASIGGREQLGEGPTAATVRVTTDGGATRILREPCESWRLDLRHHVTSADYLAVEGDFYRRVQEWPAVADRMPACLGIDRTDHVVALEDLGRTMPLTGLYRGDRLPEQAAEDLTAYLLALHGVPASETETGRLPGDALRLARHAERFEQPIAPEQVERLAHRHPRLERQVDAIRTDLHVRATMRDLGERFLEGRGSLLHGDFQPARWMPSPRGLRVLSPGLASAGPPALDVGYFMAHLILTGQPHGVVTAVLHRYRRGSAIDLAEVSACAGLEIIRGRLGRTPVPGIPAPDRLAQELDYAMRLLRGGATVELPS